ncbi:hypothetical protein HAX54_036982, partial [Datura stramonium]|nr:hypothetical protein [Datura stramonium]
MILTEPSRTLGPKPNVNSKPNLDLNLKKRSKTRLELGTTRSRTTRLVEPRSRLGFGVTRVSLPV